MTILENRVSHLTTNLGRSGVSPADARRIVLEQNPGLSRAIALGNSAAHQSALSNGVERLRQTYQGECAKKNQARGKFQEVVQHCMKEYGWDYTTAFSECKKLHPALSNAANAPIASRMLTNDQLSSLGLGQFDDDSELRAAIDAAGDKLPPVSQPDHAAIFSGLVTHWSGRDASSREVAEAKVRSRHPILSALADSKN